jgi:hypothetical protein
MLNSNPPLPSHLRFKGGHSIALSPRLQALLQVVHRTLPGLGPGPQAARVLQLLVAVADRCPSLGRAADSAHYK